MEWTLSGCLCLVLGQLRPPWSGSIWSWHLKSVSSGARLLLPSLLCVLGKSVNVSEPQRFTLFIGKAGILKVPRHLAVKMKRRGWEGE